MSTGLSTIPPNTLYPRKYKLTITTWGGKTIEIAVDQRVTFRFEKNWTQFCQFGEFVIYNLSPDTETEIFKNGKELTLQAGYENGPYGTLFHGIIWQPIRGKEDAVTYFLRLVCRDGADFMQDNFVSITLASGQDVKTMAKLLCRSASVPFEVQVPNNLTDQTLQRGKSFFGRPADYLRDIAQNNNAVVYANNGVAYIDTLDTEPPASVPDLNSKNGMVGIPRQTDEGIEFRTLIRPDLVLGFWVHINNQDIIPAQVDLGQFQSWLATDGKYRIINIICSGDTRGTDWYYDCTGLQHGGKLPGMLRSPNDSGV